MALMDMSQIVDARVRDTPAIGGRRAFRLLDHAPVLQPARDRGSSPNSSTRPVRQSHGRGIFISHYLTPASGEGVAIDGQPVNHLYFDRPLSLLLGPFLEAGLALDGLEEPAFPPGAVEASAGWARRAGDPSRARRPAAAPGYTLTAANALFCS